MYAMLKAALEQMRLARGVYACSAVSRTDFTADTVNCI